MEQLADRTGIRVEFYDPTGTRYGFPTFPFHTAPAGLATRRQLRAAGLRPGGHDPVAQILWRHRTNRRVATPAQREAIAKALLARRTCRDCGQIKPYYIPRRYGCCLDCHGGH
ncbi:RRQRL motif-containing zinc-binding protein [Micromonospora chalcea]|uniref:RRQRL motif-containing zinc-binding protein n=1 Tax=Micromonospora chalcea TaxID=1874 RepID=UPI0033D40643